MYRPERLLGRLVAFAKFSNSLQSRGFSESCEVEERPFPICGGQWPPPQGGLWTSDVLLGSLQNYLREHPTPLLTKALPWRQSILDLDVHIYRASVPPGYRHPPHFVDLPHTVRFPGSSEAHRGFDHVWVPHHQETVTFSLGHCSSRTVSTQILCREGYMFM